MKLCTSIHYLNRIRKHTNQALGFLYFASVNTSPPKIVSFLENYVLDFKSKKYVLIIYLCGIFEVSWWLLVNFMNFYEFYYYIFWSYEQNRPAVDPTKVKAFWKI